MVDIIIPVLGQFELLEKCLKSLPLAFDSVPFRVFIHDNGTSLPMEEKQAFYVKFPVKVNYGKKNYGYPVACNLAAKRGNNKLIFLLNSDIEMFPGSGKRMVEYFQNDENLGILGMKLYFPESVAYEHQQARPAGKIQHYGIGFNIQARPYHPFMGWSKDNPKVMKPIEPTAVTGAALMIRRSLWNKIGGYNPEYGLGCYEDVELAFRIRDLGKTVRIYPDCEAYHYANATAMAEQIGFPLEVNHQIFYNRWYPKLEWTDGRIL